MKSWGPVYSYVIDWAADLPEEPDICRLRVYEDGDSVLLLEPRSIREHLSELCKRIRQSYKVSKYWLQFKEEDRITETYMTQSYAGAVWKPL